MNPLPADFKFLSRTFQQLVVNYLLGDPENNVPPYSLLSSDYVRHPKSDMKSLAMMKVLMNYVKKVVYPKGVWYGKSSDWTYEHCMNLWNEISIITELKDVCKKSNRRKQLSWKLVYNVLSKCHMLEGRNKRSQVSHMITNVETQDLSTLAAVAGKATPIAKLNPTLPSLESAASSAQRKSSTSSVSTVPQLAQTHPKLASTSSKSQPRHKISSQSRKSRNVVKTTLPIARAPRKEKVVIKLAGYGYFESRKCNFCGVIPANHYCRAPRPGSMIFMEGQELLEVCGMASCNCFREKLGPAESFANKCLNCANQSEENLLTEIEI